MNIVLWCAALLAGQLSLEDVIRATPPRAALELNRQAIAARPAWRYRVVKQERVGGKLLEEQQIDVFERAKPYAVRMEYVGGPATGRKLVYDSVARPQDFRVRAHGFASLFGALWVGVDSPDARADTNHSIREVGLSNLVAAFVAELEKAEAKGGATAEHEGFNAAKHWCVLYAAPGGKGAPAAKTRVCSDVATRMVTDLALYDASGALLERYAFSAFAPVDPADPLFDPERL